jgi:hypothetical protein
MDGKGCKGRLGSDAPRSEGRGNTGQSLVHVFCELSAVIEPSWLGGILVRIATVPDIFVQLVVQSVLREEDVNKRQFFGFPEGFQVTEQK